MPFKMPEKTREVYRGLATITKAKKDNVRYFRIVLEIGKNDDKKTIEAYVNPEKCPSYLSVGRWRIALSQDKKTVFGAVPSDAVVKAQFHDIWHREGEQPVPTIKQGRYGSYLVFTWIWKSVDENYPEMIVSQELSYNFEPVLWGEQGQYIAGYTTSKIKSPRTAMLDAVLNSSGVLGVGKEEKPLPWKENLLPIIAKRAHIAREEHGVTSLLTFSNGWIISVKPATFVSDWDEEDSDYNPKQPKEPQVSVSESEEEEEEVETSKDDDDNNILWDEE